MAACDDLMGSSHNHCKDLPLQTSSQSFEQPKMLQLVVLNDASDQPYYCQYACNMFSLCFVCALAHQGPNYCLPAAHRHRLFPRQLYPQRQQRPVSTKLSHCDMHLIPARLLFRELRRLEGVAPSSILNRTLSRESHIVEALSG